MDMNLHYVSDNQFTHYSDTTVTIKQQEYDYNILVTNDAVFRFPAVDIKSIDQESLNDVFAFAPDLIIFGTGNKIIYPDPKLIYMIGQKGIGVEVMPIQALCRTFNFLVSESRKVACILFFPERKA